MGNLLELAKKLKALADKGIGGEKTNAIEMLEALCKKHNIRIEDLDQEEKKEYFFKINISDAKFFNQIVHGVNRSIPVYGEFPKKHIKEYYLPGNFAIDCTCYEYIEIEAKFNFYLALYKEEVDIFYTAFLKANDLLIVDDKSSDLGQWTEEELANYRRAVEMSGNIKKGEFAKQIGDKK